ncbi:S41 family peptidase [Xanthomonas arboricola]|uniref:S41 family peptidase n=1 Tax=Xanthomonas arboricola TaxID=56448 RepID=UPI000CEDDA7A|nr:S41 family peptidase [Xanthomonas arboricola]PPT68965.1 hypothetical protein XarbCFBP8142_10660 [Xanthomonas arboricola]
MSIDLWKILGLTALALLTAPAIPAVAATPASVISAADLRADLQTAIETIEKNHPDLEHMVDKATLRRTARWIDRDLDRPMDQTQAWSVLAQLNPVLADGHLLIGLPDWRASAASATAQGAPWFPFEVSVAASGHLRLIALLGGAPSADAGRSVSRINGVPAKEVVRTLLKRTHGDTPSARAALLSQRWWLFYAKVYGTPATFDLEFADQRGREQLAASRNVLPAVLQRDASFERLFRCEIRSTAAVLTVSTFSWPDKARFFAFTEACFTKMARERVRRLVIDIRENGGGDDDMWRDGILRYIADQPFRHGSHYIKRVLTPGPGELAGQLVEGTIESVTEPATAEPAHFTGDVNVLVGPLTYSSAVLFSNVIQDYRFGHVVGVGKSVRTRQTGGVKTLILPNTGLLLSYPRFVLDRPSGARRPKWLTPDRKIADDPLNPEAPIDVLLETND